MKIILTSNCIEIHSDTGGDELASLYPLHHNRAKTIFRTSLCNIVEVVKLAGYSVDTLPTVVQEAYYNENYARIMSANLLEFGPMRDPVINSKLTLMKHQQLGREIALCRNRYSFFYDTRTGKTPLALAIINDDVQKHPDHKWIVICPLILIDNAWIEDATRFLPDLSIISCHAATPKKRLERLTIQASVYITNTESFVRYKEHFDKMGFTGCFIDESSDMKSPSSKISKALVDFAQTVKQFYLLSGTPAPNGEYEYYMQLKAVDYYGVHQSYAQFKAAYFMNISYNPQYEKLALIPDKKDALFALIKKYAIYVDKEIVLTTPGRTFYEVEIDMPPALKASYNKLKNELYLDINEDTQITAISAAAKLNKLNQVTSGFVIDTYAKKENKYYPDNNAKEWYLLDDYRFVKLLGLLEEHPGKQVLIWANYRIEFEIIQQLLGDTCRCVYGATSLEEKNIAIQMFKEKRVQYLVANPASADKGLTLTNAHIAIYFSLNWSYELFKQSMERIYGDVRSQPKHCEYYIIIARGTVDRILYSDVLQGKGLASTSVLNHLKPDVL